MNLNESECPLMDVHLIKFECLKNTCMDKSGWIWMHLWMNIKCTLDEYGCAPIDASEFWTNLIEPDLKKNVLPIIKLGSMFGVCSLVL